MQKIVTTNNVTVLTKIVSWAIVSLGAVFYCYEYFLRIMPSVMARPLMRFYHIDATGFGNLTANYYYAYTPMQFAVGLLLDRYGPRKLLTLACACCALGSYLFGASHYESLAIIGRLLIGFGSAFAFVGAMKLAALWLPSDRLGFVTGLITTLGMIGAMIGDVAMTGMVQHDGWRETLFYGAIAGLVLTVILFVFIRDKAHEQYPETAADVTTLGELLSGLLTALMKPQMWIVGGIGGLLYLSLTAFAELWAIPYLEVVHHLSALQASSMNTAVFLGWAIGGPLVGVISDRIQRRRLPMIVSAFAAFVIATVILYLPGLSVTAVYILMILFGAACSAEVLSFALGREINHEKMAGTAVALINAFVMLGGLIFQPLIGWFLDLLWQGGKSEHGVPIYTAHSYQVAMSILPICMLLAFILTLFLKETYCGQGENSVKS